MSRVAVAAALAVLSGVAHAGDDYFSLGLHYVAPDGGRNASHGVGGSAAWALPLGGRVWLEPRLVAGILEPDASGADTASQAGAGLDLQVPFGAPDGRQWFVLAGGGALYNDVTPDTLDGGSGFVNAGLGWRSAPQAGGLRYRIELRGTQDSFDGGQADALLGFVVELRAAAPVAIVAQAPAPRTVLIEAPPPVPDADGDGVPDAEDQCAQTLAGAKVEPDGCVWQEQVVTLSNLRFASGSAQLTAEIRTRLDAVVDFFANQPDVKMDIYGHTDAQGAEGYNQRLSAGRAAAVRDYLVGKGIAARRLTSQGFGESKPIDDNETDAGRARNRRVDLHIHARQPR